MRWNGVDKRSDHETLQRWVREGRVPSICPEVAGGLAVPRRPAEIVGGAGGAKVIAGLARVVDDGGRDVSQQFVRGAEEALACARANGIRLAILKENSPSCGSAFTYDGTFSGAKLPNSGVTAALLQQAGSRVFGEDRIAEAELFFQQIRAS